MSQRSFASAEYAMKEKRTRREKFLAEMERILPWARLLAVFEPRYPTSGLVGRQPIGVPRMLGMYCLQQWCGLADEALERCSFLAGERWAIGTMSALTTAKSLCRRRHTIIYTHTLKVCGWDVLSPLDSFP